MQPLPKRRTLIIAPHADDEIFGCGGTLLRLLDEGSEVCVVVVVAGTTKFHHSGETVLMQTRVDEFETVMKYCGVSKFGVLFKDEAATNPINLDGRLDTIPIVSIVSEIESIQKKFGAERWFIPGPSFHQDHEVVNRACIAAGRPFTSFAPREILQYELPTYVYGPKHLQFSPNLFVDISQQLPRKLTAVDMYKSQIRPKTNSLNGDRLRDWAIVRGSQSGCESAEAFELLYNLV